MFEFGLGEDIRRHAAPIVGVDVSVIVSQFSAAEIELILRMKRWDFWREKKNGSTECRNSVISEYKRGYRACKSR